MTGKTPSETSPPAKAKKKIVIVDPYPIVCKGLASLIASEPDLAMCGEADGFTEAVDLVQRLLDQGGAPDLVITELQFPDGRGLELVRRVRVVGPAIKVLAYTTPDGLLLGDRPREAGAADCLSKLEPAEKLLESIRGVLGVKRPTSPGEPDPRGGLSSRELEVFNLIGEALSSQEIADRLKHRTKTSLDVPDNLSPKTIQTHREKIKGKLNPKPNGSQLAYWAARERVLDKVQEVLGLSDEVVRRLRHAAALRHQA
jgi:DNA-binding NarL/FixJ family response regulator